MAKLGMRDHARHGKTRSEIQISAELTFAELAEIVAREAENARLAYLKQKRKLEKILAEGAPVVPASTRD